MNEKRTEHDSHGRVVHQETGELTAADTLFSMLDGQLIRGRRGVWRTEVVGIHESDQDTWVQIGPARRPAEAVVIRLPPGLHADLALVAIRKWMDLPTEVRPGHIVVEEAAVGQY